VAIYTRMIGFETPFFNEPRHFAGRFTGDANFRQRGRPGLRNPRIAGKGRRPPPKIESKRLLRAYVSANSRSALAIVLAPARDAHEIGARRFCMRSRALHAGACADERRRSEGRQHRGRRRTRREDVRAVVSSCALARKFSCRNNGLAPPMRFSPPATPSRGA